MRISLTSPSRSIRPFASGLALAALVGGALLLPVSAQAAAGCPGSGGEWIREDRAGEQAVSATVAAPSLMLIVETCVSTGDAVSYATYSPGQGSVTVTSPTTGGGSQLPISHVSYRVEMKPQVPGACLPELTPCPPDESTPAPTPSPSPETAAPAPPPAPPGTPGPQTPAAAPHPPASVPSAPAAAPDASTAAADPEVPGLTTVSPAVPRTTTGPAAHRSDTAGAPTVVSAVSRAAAPLDSSEPDRGPVDLRVLLAALLLGAGAAATVVLRRRGSTV